jgi:hypothetical protein
MNQTINIGIATLPERSDSLKKVLESLTNQADNIYIVLNRGGHDIAQWIGGFKNDMWVVGDNRLGSSHKFTMASHVKGWFITWDDDLVLKNPQAINYLIRGCERYDSICTLHGKRYDGERPIKSYRKSITTNIRCLNNWSEDTEVHVGGTGCMAWNTNRFKISLDDFKHKNMSDVECAKVASDQGVKIMALSHSCNYVEYIPPKGKTIWQTSSDDTVQTQILNSFLK